MVTELVRLHQALQGLALPLDVAGAAEQRQAYAETIRQLEDYVIPRVMTVDAPLLAVVGGSTGAGKSTLVNSIVGSRVTASGLLRPTTRSPVLVHHPDDAQWFGQDRLLPDLVRVDHETNDPDALQLVASTAVPRGLAILDAPDVDSVEEQNRLLAAQLLMAADLWLFVTSAARYADQVPWGFLKAAAERSTSVAVVLDRTPDDAVRTVATHLARMLAARGLKDSPLFIVHEGEVSPEGLLPAGYVIDIRRWIDILAADPGARAAVAAQTLDGAIRSIAFKAHGVADAAAAQSAAVESLRAAAVTEYDAAVAATASAGTDGTLLRGEVLTRWQELAGSGAIAGLELRGSRFGRGRLKDGKHLDAATASIASAIELLVLEQAEAAAERVVIAWRGMDGGSRLADTPDLGRASRGLRSLAGRSVAAWQQDVLDLVRDAGSESESDPEALSVALMAGALGATEVGDDVAGLVPQARAALAECTTALLRGEETRFTSMLDALAIDAEAPARVRQAARRVDDVRYATHNGDALGPTGADALGQF